jgi:putative tryptophan/tyrosine transport system substrate-binding protein
MRRRDFITVLAGATAWMSAARAQEPRRTIGVLGSASYGAFPGAEPAFIQGLKTTGFLEGENIFIEWRWAGGQYNRLPSQAAELVDCSVAVIVAFDVPAAFAAKAATKTTPIVFLAGADPVRLALVDSLNQPHGNLTGVSHLLNSLAPKQLELLHELVPGVRRVALLVNPNNRNSRIDTPEVQAAADALGQHLEVLTAGAENELDTAFATMARQRIDALVVKGDPFFISQRERLVALAARYAVAVIYPLPEFVKLGGLISYGGNMVEAYRQEGIYTGRILKGAKPADLPIQQSTKFERAINLKTAKTLGLTAPPSLLARADEVIE